MEAKAAQKSLEIQAQVRHNTEEYQNTIKDLYKWEKAMKSVEEQKKKKSDQPAPIQITSPVGYKQPMQKKTLMPASMGGVTKVEIKNNVTGQKLAEKKIKGLDLHEKRHKQADEIKDRGNEHVKQGHYEKAIFEYSAAMDVYPDDYIYYCNRAFCYLKLQRYNECIEDCDKAIEMDKSAVKAYYRRMQANEGLGNNMDALKDCTTILSIEPKNADAKKSLNRINDNIRKNVKSSTGPNFTSLRKDTIDIWPIDKPPYKRSHKPLVRVAIADVVGPKDSESCDYLNISDEDIDKLFNSNCGPFVEVKKDTTEKTVNEKRMPATQTVENKETTDQTNEKIAEKSTVELKSEEENQIAKITPDPVGEPKINENNEEDFVSFQKDVKAHIRKIIDNIEEEEIKDTKPEVHKNDNSNEIENNNDKDKQTIEESAKIETDTKKLEETTVKKVHYAETKKNNKKRKKEAKRNAKIEFNKVESNQDSECKSSTSDTASIDVVLNDNKAVEESDTKILTTTTEATEATSQRLVPSAPTCTAQFYTIWKELPAVLKFEYLKSVQIPQLCKILGASLDSKTLMDIIYVLRDYYVPNKEKTTTATLLEISKNNQVNILSLFMTAEERKVLTDILCAIKETNENTTTAATIAKNFNLNEI